MAEQSDNTMDVVLFNTHGNEPDDAQSKANRLEAMKDVLQRIRERSPNPVLLCQDNIDEEKRFLLWSSLDPFQQCPGIHVTGAGKSTKPLVGIFQHRNPERTYDMRYIPYQRLGDMADICGVMNFMCCVLAPRSSTQMISTNKRILMAVVKYQIDTHSITINDTLMRLQKEEQCEIVDLYVFTDTSCFTWKRQGSTPLILCGELEPVQFEEKDHSLKLRPTFYQPRNEDEIDTKKSSNVTVVALSPIKDKEGNSLQYPYTKCIGNFFDQFIPTASSNLFVIVKNSNDQLLNGSLDEIHRIITKKLGASSCKTKATENEAAAVYFRPDLPYLTRFVDTTPVGGQTSPPKQNKERNDMPSTSRSTLKATTKSKVNFAGRIKACVLETSHAPETNRILLISYHGPNNTSEENKEKCFTNLVTWADDKCCKERYNAVLVGGDWNIKSSKMPWWKHDMQGESSKQGKLAENYRREKGTKKRPKLDYLYYWPVDQLDVMSTTPIRHDNETFGRCKPFNHPVVLYRIKFKGGSQSKTISQTASKPAATEPQQGFGPTDTSKEAKTKPQGTSKPTATVQQRGSGQKDTSKEAKTKPQGISKSTATVQQQDAGHKDSRKRTRAEHQGTSKPTATVQQQDDGHKDSRKRTRAEHQGTSKTAATEPQQDAGHKVSRKRTREDDQGTSKTAAIVQQQGSGKKRRASQRVRQDDQGDQGVSSDDRKECVKHVLKKVLKDTGPDLFVLGQEIKYGSWHKILCETLGMDSQPALREEAGIYYRQCKGSQQHRGYSAKQGSGGGDLLTPRTPQGSAAASWRGIATAASKSPSNRYALASPESYPSKAYLQEDERTYRRRQQQSDHVADSFESAASLDECPGTSRYHVTYLDVGKLQKVEGKLKFEPGNDFTIARLSACVLSNRSPGPNCETILLVTWHGPHRRVDHSRKEACFDVLIRFVEKLRTQEKCAITVLGGDFNLDVKKVHEIFKTPFKNTGRVDATVLDNYTPTDDRENLDMIDYVIYWPARKLRNIKTSVECKTFRRDRPRPFDHNIILFRFAICSEPVPEQKRQTASEKRTEAAQRSLSPRDSTEKPKEDYRKQFCYPAKSKVLSESLDSEPSTHKDISSAKWKAHSASMDARLTTKPSRQGLLSAAREPQEGDTPHGKAPALPTSARQPNYPQQINPKDRKKGTSSSKTTSAGSSEFVCDICGQDCHARIGLWSHQHHKHGTV